MQTIELLNKSIEDLETEINIYKEEIDKLRIQLRKLKRIRKTYQ